MQNFLFAFEVEVNGTIGNTGFTRNVSNLGIEITAAGEHTYRRAQNCLSFITNRESFIGSGQRMYPHSVKSSVGYHKSIHFSEIGADKSPQLWYSFSVTTTHRKQPPDPYADPRSQQLPPTSVPHCNPFTYFTYRTNGQRPESNHNRNNTRYRAGRKRRSRARCKRRN